MFCPTCGKELSDGATFCPGCGTALNGKSGANGANSQKTSSKFFDLSRMNIIGIVASIAVLLAVFLPFASIDIFGTKESVSLIDGSDGILFIIIAVAGAVFSVLNLNIVVIIAGAISTVFFFIENANLSGSDADELTQLAASMIQKEFGYYLLIIGSIGLIVAGLVGFVLKKKK